MKDNVYKTILLSVALPLIMLLIGLYVGASKDTNLVTVKAIEDRMTIVEEKTKAIDNLSNDMTEVKTNVKWITDEIKRKQSLLPSLLAVPTQEVK